MKGIKKLVAAILVFAVCFGLCSCSVTGNVDEYAISLSAEKLSVSYKDSQDEDYQVFLEKLSLFSASLSSALYENYGGSDSSDTNLCFSPISVYMMLAMAAESSDGETRAEILNALGMSYEELREHTALLYAFMNRSFTYSSEFSSQKKISAFEEMHNSLWIDNSVAANMNTVKVLSEDYNADVLSVPFSDGTAKKLIAKYIDEKTHGLIDGNIEFSEDTLFTLLNTFYMKEIWNYTGNALKRTDAEYDFKNTDGSTASVRLLKGYYSQGKVYQGENYQSFYTETDHSFKLHFILPDEGVSLDSVFTEETLSDLLGGFDYMYVDDENRQLHNTRIFFPEFSASFDEDISSVLSEDFGIRDFFSKDNADFSPLYDGELWCDAVIHRTSITVDEIGIEGAAITAAMLAGSAGPPEYEEVFHDFVVDGAFGFVLTDSYGTVLFSGIVNDING